MPNNQPPFPAFGSQTSRTLIALLDQKITNCQAHRAGNYGPCCQDSTTCCQDSAALLRDGDDGRTPTCQLRNPDVAGLTSVARSTKAPVNALSFCTFRE